MEQIIAQPTLIYSYFKTVTHVYLLFIAFILLVNFSLLRKYKKRANSALSLLPGPKGLPIVGNVLEFLNFSDSVDTLLKLGKKYPDCYHLSPLNQNFLIITSGTVAHDLLKSAKFSHTFKPKWATVVLMPYLHYGVGIASGHVHWKNERKFLLPTMSLQSIRHYLKGVNASSKMLVDEINKMFQDGKCHAVNEMVNACVISHTAEMISGTRITDLEECLEHHRSFKRYVILMTERVDRPWLWVDFFYRFHRIAKERETIEKILNKFGEKRLNEAKVHQKELENNPSMERCMMDALIDADVPEYLLYEEVKFLMAAGYETVGSTINFTMWMLGLYPEHQELCRKEVDDLFAKNDELSLEDLNSLKYLNMCISESLRLFPVAFLLSRHLKESLTIEYNEQKVEVPANVNVVIDMMSVHRHPVHYPNPNKFDPSRFTPEEIAKRPPHTFFPFSSGVRGCIGSVYAMAASKIHMANLLRNFTWSTTETMESVRIVAGINIRPEHDIKFSFYKRAN